MSKFYSLLFTQSRRGISQYYFPITVYHLLWSTITLQEEFDSNHVQVHASFSQSDPKECRGVPF